MADTQTLGKVRLGLWLCIGCVDGLVKTFSLLMTNGWET